MFQLSCVFSLGFVSALLSHVITCTTHCFVTGLVLSLFSVTTHFMLAAFLVRLSLNSLWILLVACEVGTSPFCGLLTHHFYNLHHWLISCYLKFFEDFSVVSCLISFRVFVKEQFCMFSLLLEFSDCVCFHDWFWFPVSSCCLLSCHQSRPLPRPRGCSFPSISPAPYPTCSGHGHAVVHSVCALGWVCALSSWFIKWCFSPIAVSWIGESLCSYRRKQW